MSTLPLRDSHIPHVSVLPVVAAISAVLDVFAEAQNLASAAQKRYPFAEW